MGIDTKFLGKPDPPVSACHFRLNDIVVLRPKCQRPSGIIQLNFASNSHPCFFICVNVAVGPVADRIVGESMMYLIC